MPDPAFPPTADVKPIDLREMSMAQLVAEAATTQARDVFAALLPDPPGELYKHGATSCFCSSKQIPGAISNPLPAQS
jgi:hypothetical protein